MVDINDLIVMLWKHLLLNYDYKCYNNVLVFSTDTFVLSVSSMLN